MTLSLFDPPFEALPDIIPVFPLEGVVLLPHAELPLNIFEPRYLAMVGDALRSGHRLIGMIQPSGSSCPMRAIIPDLFATGCAGRITRFEETPDGRYLITLKGLCRFRIVAEEESVSGYRRMRVGWGAYEQDMSPVGCLDLDRDFLHRLLQTYLPQCGLDIDWELVADTDDAPLISALAMVCPLSPGEKQALLEAGCCRSRADLFLSLLDMAVRGAAAGKAVPH
jgi:Lon protease-like protein